MSSENPRPINTAFIAGFLACALLGTLTTLCLYWINRQEVNSHSTDDPGPVEDPNDGETTTKVISIPDGYTGPDADEGPATPTLPRGASALSLTLLDHRSKPVASAETELVFLQKSEKRTTDAEGRAEFFDIAPDSYVLRVYAPPRPDLVTARRLVTHEGEMLSVTFVLQPYDQIIAGQVVDSSGTPIPGVQVRSLRNFSEVVESDLIPFGEDTRITPCDDQGMFAINRLDHGEYQLRLFGSKTHAPTDRLISAGTLDAKIVLETGREIRFHGRITDKEGKPVHYAEVSCRGREHAKDLTNKDGMFTFKRIVRPNETITLQVRANRYRTTRRAIHPEQHLEFDEWECDFEIESQLGEAWIAGTVASRSGKPLIGQRIEIYSAKLDVRRSGISNASGAFRIDRLPEGDDYRVLVRPRRQFRDWSRGPVAIKNDGQEISIVLESLPKAYLTGEVVDAHGEPVSGWAFELYGEKSTRQRITSRTDASGFFEIDEAPTGKIVLTSKSPPHFVVRGHEIEPGAVADLRFVVDIGEHEIHGTIVDDETNPVTDANVKLSWQSADRGTLSSSLRTATTDSNGRFSFRGVGPGKHTIAVDAETYASAERKVDPAKSHRAIAIAIEKLVEVTPEDEEGEEGESEE